MHIRGLDFHDFAVFFIEQIHFKVAHITLVSSRNNILVKRQRVHFSVIFFQFHRPYDTSI